MVNDELLTEAEAAEVLRFSTGGLANARRAGRSPPFTRIGRQIRYRARDLVQYLDRRTHGSDENFARTT